MNYFGLFFSFMLPGILLGMMGAIAIYQEVRKNKRRALRAKAMRAARSCAPVPVDRSRLYVYDMSNAA